MVPSTPLTTPVVLIIFNRPDLTQQVFEAIAQAKPNKFFVIADGPRHPEEAEKCKQARSVINKVNWTCEVLTNFSEQNLGCALRVSTGLDWVFSLVNEAIILEDDCLPSESFFQFCQTLLEYYRFDERIMAIGGSNLEIGNSRTDYSYYFSKYSYIWGWATWSRAWKHFDFQMKLWPEFEKLNVINSICKDRYEKKYWINIFTQVDQCFLNSWDYKWLYTIWCQRGLTIVPYINLVSNIGFRSDATHTHGESPLSKLPTSNIWEINHPPFIVENYEADQYLFDYVYGGNFMRKQDSLIGKIKQMLSPIKRSLSKD
jgi:hypothetical protein